MMFETLQNRRGVARRATALFACVLVVAGVAAAEKPPPPTRERAFATIGRQGYAPFYSYVITPHAVVVKGTVYCAFQNDKGQPIVMAYDAAAKRWSGPVAASKFGLGDDAHGNPSLYVDRRGHLHLFYGCHGKAMRHTKSARPLDITAWEEQPAPAPRATYPQSMRLASGKMYLMYRAGGHKEPWTLLSSGDDCSTWSKGEKIIEMRLAPKDPQAAAYAYFLPGRQGRTIHCFWNHKDDNAGRINAGRMTKHPWRPLKYKGLHEAVYRYNMYYIRRGADGVWRSAAGEAMKLPISKALADAKCMLFDSGDEFAYPGRLAVDAKNNPYIRISTGVRDWHGAKKTIVPMRSRYARLRGGKWQVTDQMPGDWPAEAAEVIRSPGLAAYGDNFPVKWFIGRRGLRPEGTAVYLLHGETGYATRAAGPAGL